MNLPPFTTDADPIDICIDFNFKVGYGTLYIEYYSSSTATWLGQGAGIDG